MNILLAADGSPFTIKAAEYLIEHFDWFKEKPALHLFHVKSPIHDGYVRSVVGHAALEDYYKDEADAALVPADALLKSRDIAFQRSYAVGDISDEIQAYVKQHNIDMIVMGSHGFGSIRNLVMGSVATKVLAETTVPVLLIR